MDITTETIDVNRKLKEALFGIINHPSAPRESAYYGGVLVNTPNGPKLAYLHLTFADPPTGA